MPNSNVAGFTALTAGTVAAGDLFHVYDLTGPEDKKLPADSVLSALFRLGGAQSVYGNLNPSSGNSYTLGNAGAGLEWYSAAAQRLVLGDSSTSVLLKRAAAGVAGLTDTAETAGGTLSSIPLSPSQITSNQNDYAPGVARYYRLSTDASRTLTGLVAGVDGEEREIWNVGSFNLVLAHQSASSTAANRFVCPYSVDLLLQPGDSVQLRYDGTTARWRAYPVAVVTKNGAGPTQFYATASFNIALGSTLSTSTGFAVRDANAWTWAAGGSRSVDMSSSGLKVRADGAYAFSTDPGLDAADTALTRAAAKVIGLTDGSTAGGTLSSVPLSPSQITANQNDYAPGVAHTYRLSADAARSVTGLSISQVNGQWGRIFNVGANAITLEHQDAASTAANRFLCVTGADIVLAADEGAEFEYDSTTARFRVWKL